MHSTSSADTPVNEIQARAEARVGMKLLGEYELLDVAGIGGSSAFYIATDRREDFYGIKIAHDAQEEQTAIVFQREFEVSKRVKHPSIVEIFERGQTDLGEPFLVMDYVVGQSLSEHCWERGGVLPWAEVLQYAYDLAILLETIHAKGVFHGDLKPHNVIVAGGSGAVYLIDFGIAKISAAGDAPAFDDPRANDCRRFFGTFGYVAPEQASGIYEQINARSDIFSFGAMLHKMLTGELPNQIRPGAMSPLECWLRTSQQTAPISMIADIPAPVAKIVDTALRFDERERYANAREMRFDIRRAFDCIPRRRNDRH